MLKSELLKNAQSLYVSVEKVRNCGNYAQAYFRMDIEEFGLYEHTDSGSYVPIGGNDGYISIPVSSIFEDLYEKYTKSPTKKQMADAIVRYVIKKGVDVDDD